MTVSTTLNKITYQGDGATTSFPFTFPGVAAADVQVFFTDANGNVTLLAANQYTLVLNPATGTNPTGAGGTVTYNPLGTPIAIGTQLTIMRTLPLTQATSFSNQTSLYQQTIELTFDYQTMLAQQILEVQSRALVVAVSDTTPGILPAVAARKNQVLGFDNNGNPIAVSTAPAGVISSAMQPVVNAATLAVGRTAFGLGAIATEGIGSGLQDDGASNVRTFFNEVADSTPQSVTVGFHQNVRAATGALTYTLPRANTLFNGFGFWVYALTGALTFAINAADAFSGAATGASLVVPPGSRVFVSTDAQASGTWYIRGIQFPTQGRPLNCSFVTSVNAGALTVALKDANGNDPSPASPVIFTTSIGGTIVPRAVTGPLSVTAPSGASLGSVNGVACRIWVGLFDNAGTPILGLYNSLINTNPSFSLLPWDETTAPATTTAISAGSTAAQVWYTSSGLTTKPFCIVGYLEAIEATAGNWATSPSKAQLFGPGVKRPGETVSEVMANFAAGAAGLANSLTFAVSGLSGVIFVGSAANLVFVEANGAWFTNGVANATTTFALARSASSNTNVLSPQASMGEGNTSAQSTSPVFAYDIPGAGNITYTYQYKTSVGAALTVNFLANSAMRMKEIQI